MSLRQLRIENFKAIRGPVDLDFGKLTFLYGPNSAGKSAVLDALDLLVAIGSGDLPGAYELSRLRHANSDRQGIRLGVIVYIDGYALSGLGTSRFMEMEKLHGVLADGAAIDLDIELHPEDGLSGIKALDISIEGQPVVAYRDTRDIYGPYFTSSLDKHQGEKIEPILNLVGEWRINKDHPASQDLLVTSTRRSARAKRAFDELHDNIVAIRGLICNAKPVSNQWVEIDQDSLDLVFPRNVQDITAGPKAPSSLYWDKTDLTSHTSDPNFYCHANYLKQFETVHAATDLNRYMEFLQEEFSQENSAELFSELRQQAAQLNAFVEAVFFTVAQAIRLPRVPGSRANTDSCVPIHVKSPYAQEYDQAPREMRSAFSGALLYEFERESAVFHGARELRSAHSLGDIRVLTLLGPYASAWARAARAGKQLDESNDFPNFCLRQYLRSLSKYSIAPDTYFIMSPNHSEIEDDSLLAGSSLVFFSLEDSAGGRRAFADVGSGVGYVFPILAALGYFGHIAIEQPELHLHPMAQGELADVFIHAANTPGEYSTRHLIIESHSEIFLLQVAKRIRESYALAQAQKKNVKAVGESLQLYCDQVRIYYFSPRRSGGTEVMMIRFAPDGSLIDEWPEGMFSKDWTSGLDRMKFFLEEFDSTEAERVLPWIKGIEDVAVRKWLAIGWLLEKLGDAATESTVISWGRIVEKVMADNLLEPLRGRMDVSWFGDKRMGQGLHDFFQRGQRPGLGWWYNALIALKRDFGIQPRFTVCMRDYICEQSWAKHWTEFLGGDLIPCFDALIKARNPAAHAGHAELEHVRQARGLIMVDGQPGLLFHALGLVKRGPPRLA